MVVEIMSAGDWRTNAEMIADVAKLGYIGEYTLDLTYGLGKFWTIFEPEELFTNDIHPEKGEFSYDFTGKRMPKSWFGAFDTVVLDPPYRLSPSPQRNPEVDDGVFDKSYGIEGGSTPAEVQDLYRGGIRFGGHCLNRGGHLLVKSQAQVSGGQKRWQPYEIHDMARDAGCWRLKDEFHLKGGRVRKQPAGRQVHSRSNFSTLQVFVKK